MAKIIVFLREQEHAALYRLAEKEYRQPKAQAALIIRRELERLGALEAAPETERVCEEGPDEH
ncbi:MAG: hypothetical protein HOE06_06175 [Candidatus Thioglobus sp.]|jgi:hypothetical protein|nr:hypothetical protein [Candidatus Thioglobus sp.]